MAKANTIRLAVLGFLSCILALPACGQETQPADLERQVELLTEKVQAVEEKANAAQAAAENAGDDRYAVLKAVEGFFDRAFDRIFQLIGFILIGLAIAVPILLWLLEKQRKEMFKEEMSSVKKAGEHALEESDERHEEKIQRIESSVSAGEKRLSDGLEEALQQIGSIAQQAHQNNQNICHTAGILWLEFARRDERSCDFGSAWCNYCHAVNSWLFTDRFDWLLIAISRLINYCEDESANERESQAPQRSKDST